MATSESDKSPDDRAAAELPKRRPRRRWLWTLGGILVALALLVFFAPFIVAHTALRQQIVPAALPDFEGQCHIGSASLGWFSPIVLKDVVIVDAQGDPLLSAARVASDKSLWALVRDSRNLGLFRIDGPQLSVVLRPNGSNIEDAIGPLLIFEEPAEDLPGVGVSIEITGGRIDVVETATGLRTTADKLAISLHKPQDAAKPLTAKLTAKLTADVATGAESGTLAAQLTWTLPETFDDGSLGEGRLTLGSDSLPLAVLGAAVRRALGQADVAGTLQSDLQCQWAGSLSRPVVTLRGSADAAGFRWASGDGLAARRIEMARVGWSGRVSLDTNRVQLVKWTIDSDLGRVEVSGAADWNRLASGQFVQALTDVARHEDFSVKGRIDLARLAALLPDTLRIRPGTQITSGNLQVTLAGRTESGQRLWQGRVEMADLAAIDGGRTLVWQQPILATLSAHDTQDGPVVDELVCRSDFLELTGRGTARKLTVSVRSDLTRLVEQIGQFVDLGELRLAGSLSADVGWERGSGDAIQAGGDVVVENFQLAAPGVRPWHERRLSISLTAAGLVDANGPYQIDWARVKVESPRDLLNVTLREPVTDVSAKTAWPVDVTLRGDLAQWLPRVQAWLPLEGWDIAGVVDLSGRATVSTERVAIEQAKADVRQLVVRGDGVTIEEPLVRIETSGTWDQIRGCLASKMTTLASSSVSLRVDDLALELQEQALPAVSADVAFRGDLARLCAWFADGQTPPAYRLLGQVAGGAKLAHSAGTTSVELGADVTDLAVLMRETPAGADPADPAGRAELVAAAPPRWQSVWTEKRLTLSGGGSYRHEADSAELKDLQLTSKALSLRASGKVAELTTQCNADVSGQIVYDLRNVTEWLRSYIGPGLQIDGRQTRPFALRGPLRTPGPAPSPTEAGAPDAASSPAAQGLVSDELTGNAAFGWDAANVYGLPVGEGQIVAKLARGVVDVSPIDFTVSDGRVRLVPQLRLNDSPAMLVVEPGRIVSDLQLSPEMCDTWLRYVAPMLANSTRVDGRFSLDVTQASFPLFAPADGQVAGVLTIHGAHVRPGPLAELFVALARQVRMLITRQGAAAGGGQGGWLQIAEQKVEFQMANGYVTHRGLTMTAGDMVIRTSGTVGVDQTLAITLEVPILDEWVERDRLLAGLKGQVLRVPIRGTFAKPQVDRRELERFAKRMAAQAAGRLIENELYRGLDELFRQ